jgi:hypothetical protein
VFYGHSNANALATAGKEIVDMLCRIFSEANTHCRLAYLILLQQLQALFRLHRA